MKTTQDVEIDFRHYGKIKVPKGTRVTNKTATGIDSRYFFVDEFEWIDRDYPQIAFGLHWDAEYYGINIPEQFIE